MTSSESVAIGYVLLSGDVADAPTLPAEDWDTARSSFYSAWDSPPDTRGTEYDLNGAATDLLAAWVGEFRRKRDAVPTT